MAQNVTAGWASYVNYGFETTYGTDSSTYPKIFGAGQKITITRKNNMERVNSLGFRNAQSNVAKQYTGSTSIEFDLSNATFFRGILGSIADGGGGGPTYTHTYSEANTVPSFSIATGTELGTNDEVSVLLGNKINTFTLTAAVNEIVKCRLETLYKTETLATSGAVSQVTEDYIPFTFAQGVLSIGGTVNYVQSIEMTLNNNLENVFGLGSRFTQSSVEKNREYNVRMTVTFSDVTTLLTKFFGASGAPVAGNPAAQATLVLTFDNGAVDATENKIVITLANLYLDEETLPKSATEVIKEDVGGWCLSGTSVVWTNGTSADNATP